MGYIAHPDMIARLTIIRYRKRFIPFALLSMALFRIPLWLNKNISFWKLLGTGKNGTFSKQPDWVQWGILSVVEGVGGSELGVRSQSLVLGGFIQKWLKLFNCETWTIWLEPLEGHGKWDGKEVFGVLPKQAEHEGKIAVLTRATIRFSKMKNFWSNVEGVSAKMRSSPGFIGSLGIGEIPWKKQATFSIWESRESMKEFAYRMKEHAEVIRKTRAEQWYSEEMFVRFRVLDSAGTINGTDISKN
jgi:hypothetical protein